MLFWSIDRQRWRAVIDRMKQNNRLKTFKAGMHAYLPKFIPEGPYSLSISPNVKITNTILLYLFGSLSKCNISDFFWNQCRGCVVKIYHHWPAMPIPPSVGYIYKELPCIWSALYKEPTSHWTVGQQFVKIFTVHSIALRWIGVVASMSNFPDLNIHIYPS